MAVPIRVLFVCTDNASRSQMAEAWLRHLGGDRFVARSAGTAPSHLHAAATRVMQEAEVFIGAQRGKGLDGVKLERFDLLVTLDDEAVERASELPAEWAREHRHFDDPSFLEDPDGPDTDAFRELRDELRTYIEQLIARRGQPEPRIRDTRN